MKTKVKRRRGPIDNKVDRCLRASGQRFRVMLLSFGIDKCFLFKEKVYFCL